MPKCKNAPTVYYKGTEPSPKGRGYCARAESIGKRRKGTDSQMWVVKSHKMKGKSVKRWQRVCVRAPLKTKKVSRVPGKRVKLEGGGYVTDKLFGMIQGAKKLAKRLRDSCKDYGKKPHTEESKQMVMMLRQQLHDIHLELSHIPQGPKRLQLEGELNGVVTILNMYNKKYKTLAHSSPKDKSV